MTLGELITALEAADAEQIIPNGFDTPHSYRGYYNELAFEPATDITVAEMLEAARSALGETYEGWKGGQYKMTAHTDCWLAEEGCLGETIGPLLLKLMLAFPTSKPDMSRVEAAARRALDSLGGLILNTPDPGVEALGAQFELRQALLDAIPEIPTTRTWTIEARRRNARGDIWTRWNAPYDELSEDAHKDYAETVAEWGHQRAFRIVCATTTHVIEAQHEPDEEV